MLTSARVRVFVVILFLAATSLLRGQQPPIVTRLEGLDAYMAQVLKFENLSIHRILVHACYDESQRTRTWRTSVTALPIDLPGPPDSASAIADRDELERAFKQLSIEQRAVFVLHHYLGLPLVEVAELLGVPAGTARSRLHYAIAGLRHALTAVPEPIAREGRLA